MKAQKNGVAFKLRGKTYRLTKEEVEHRLESIEPRPSEKYSVVVAGKLFPPKQILSEALDIPVLEFTTMDAQRILRKIGFEVTEASNVNHLVPIDTSPAGRVRNNTGRTGVLLAGPIRDAKGRDWMVVQWENEDDPDLHLTTDLWRPYQ